MKSREWTFLDKAKWGAGPWNSEPDKLQWMTGATLPGLIVRNPDLGALCGYAGVVEGHPLFGIHYGEESIALGEAYNRRMEEPIGEQPAFGILVAAILGGGLKQSPESVFTVHGGITYSDFCQLGEHGICHVPDAGEPDRVWWFGFDCAHCDDLIPSYRELGGIFETPMLRGMGVYRDASFVRAEVESLARQLVAVAA